MAAKQAGQVEDEAALRDAVLLARPGDEVGPAGLLLLAWRRLATRPAEELLTEKNLAEVLKEFGHSPVAPGELAEAVLSKEKLLTGDIPTGLGSEDGVAEVDAEDAPVENRLP